MNIRTLIKGRLNLFVKCGRRSARIAGLTTLFVVLLYVPLRVFGQSSVDFAVIGDYGHAGSGERDVANLVKSWNPDLIITTGDNNYPDGTASTIDANIGQYYHEFIFPYIGTYGDGAATNRFFPSLGNHDWHAPDAQPYVNYFVLPGNERYYEFVRGPVHFFAIDSDQDEVDGDTEGSEQGQWLKDRLASASEPWKVVYFHHPPYSSGHHGSTTRMRWHFKEWGASAILSGHDHTYERLSVDGFPYFVDGLGGASRYDFETILPSSQVRYNDTYRAMLVNADAGSITFRFFNIAGTLIDSLSLSNGEPSTIDAPTGLQARAVSANQVDMSWNDNSSNETGFEIDRCGAAGCSDFAEIARVATNVENYTDPSVSFGTYRYRVRAFNSTAESGFSNIVEVSTAPTTDVFSDDFDDGVIDQLRVAPVERRDLHRPGGVEHQGAEAPADNGLGRLEGEDALTQHADAQRHPIHPGQGLKPWILLWSGRRRGTHRMVSSGRGVLPADEP